MAESEQGRIEESQKEWNRERTEKLISEMEKRPELYDTTLKAYSNRDTRKKICDEIGLILGVTGMSPRLFILLSNTFHEQRYSDY